MKNIFRHDQIGNNTGEYSVEFYDEYDAIKSLNEDIDGIWNSFFLTWITIVKGDFDDHGIIVWELFVLLSTFISNVVLLNLIIAFMSDAYANVMTTIF